MLAGHPVNASFLFAASDIKFGYAAITWGGNDLQAIKEISEVGYRGIQLRSSILKDYSDKPKALSELLKQYKLNFVALSGGGPSGPDYIEADVIATQAKNAVFLRETDGTFLQIIDSSRPKGRKPVADDFKRMGRVLNEMGKHASDAGVTLVYHNHMNGLGEGPTELDSVMEASDPRYVKLLMDVAHCKQGGGDPVAAIKQYQQRIVFLHIKDVQSPVPDEPNRAYRFVELGRGKVDLPAVFQALKEINYRGWAVIELDAVPDKNGTPKESAIINKRYLEEKLKMKV
jgi:inosose dehydratase